jgi:hypothetical protein
MNQQSGGCLIVYLEIITMGDFMASEMITTIVGGLRQLDTSGHG